MGLIFGAIIHSVSFHKKTDFSRATRLYDVMSKHNFITSFFTRLRFGVATLLAILIVLVSMMSYRESYALDPSRSLTQYLHRIWQVQQGLPPSTIFSIEQTSDGYLWLGTQTGLIRFDGLRFTEMNKFGDVSLEKQSIVQIVEDETHALWIATKNNGLYKIVCLLYTSPSPRD